MTPEERAVNVYHAWYDRHRFESAQCLTANDRGALLTHIEDGIRAAVAEEREACLALIRVWDRHDVEVLAAAVRARG